MKNKFITLSLVLLSLVLSSCTTKKITVKGNPGSKIYYPNKSYLAVIPESGTVTVKIPKGHYSYLFSQKKETGEYVPFALNYKNNHFEKLLTEQTTNDDVTLSPLVQTADYKTSSDKETKREENKKQSAVKNYEKEVNNETKAAVAENKVNNVSEDKSRREERKPTASSIDYSGSVVGTYVGKGRILESGEVTERFNSMTVIVKPYSDNAVKVSVKVSGLLFFRDEAIYSVSKSNGMFVMNNKTLNSTIKVDEYGDMSYERKKMDEYGSDGVLKVTAEKK